LPHDEQYTHTLLMMLVLDSLTL